jgi:excisionase family DNA binding protein
MIGVLSALWFAPVGALAARWPLLAVPVAIATVQAVTWPWAALNLSVAAVAGAAVLVLGRMSLWWWGHIPLPTETAMEDARVSYLNVAQAADYLGVSERQVRSLVYRQTIPYTKVGRLLRFNVAELDRWLDANTVRPDA